MMLTQTRKVMHYDFTRRHEARVFVTRDDDTGKVLSSVHLTYPDWADMGKPETITVSIEPGDTLNA